MVASLKEFKESRPESTRTDNGEFRFLDFFHGHTHASGWFADRFGRPRKHFSGEFHGTLDSDRLILSEYLLYSDAMEESRIWEVSVDDSGALEAVSESLIGKARGQHVGNRLDMRYTMEIKVAEGQFWKLDMKDLMVLQPDGILHNITQVYKWGIRIGTVSAQYRQKSSPQ